MNNAPEMSEQEKVLLLKRSLLNSIKSQYVELVKSIRALPINQGRLNNIYYGFDTGMLWLQEYLTFLPLQLGTQPPAQGENPAPAQSDNGTVQDNLVPENAAPVETPPAA